MKLKGTVEIEESDYRRDLELAFANYLEEDTKILSYLGNV